MVFRLNIESKRIPPFGIFVLSQRVRALTPGWWSLLKPRTTIQILNSRRAPLNLLSASLCCCSPSSCAVRSPRRSFPGCLFSWSQSMFTSLRRLVRSFKSIPGRKPVKGRQCYRLAVEPLEDRITPNNRFVVPLGAAVDNATTFHTLATALTTAGLASGDIIQIEPGSEASSIADADLPAVTNLTIRGDRSFPLVELPTVITSNAISV